MPIGTAHRLVAAASRNLKLTARAAIMLLPLRYARRAIFWANYRRSLHLDAPRTFNEKVNWRIVNDRRAVLATFSSKVASKKWARDRCATLAVPRTLWHGTDLGKLATVEIPGPWVLKTSHRSGLVIFGDGPVDVESMTRATRGWLRRRLLREGRQWAYSRVTPEFILEERIGHTDEVPNDYKFFVFDGQVHLVQVDRGRFGQQVRNLYSPTWEELPYTYTWPAGPPIPPPATLPEMLHAASTLGEGIDFVRVDLFDVDGVVYFGELTVYPGGGLSHWPVELDEWLGQHWRLPTTFNLEHR
jgi:hypothetical protein